MSILKPKWLEAKDLNAKLIDTTLPPEYNVVKQFGYDPLDAATKAELKDAKTPWFVIFGWTDEAMRTFWTMLYKAYGKNKKNANTVFIGGFSAIKKYGIRPPTSYVLDAPTCSKETWKKANKVKE